MTLELNRSVTTVSINNSSISNISNTDPYPILLVRSYMYSLPFHSSLEILGALPIVFSSARLFCLDIVSQLRVSFQYKLSVCVMIVHDNILE